MVLTRSIHDHEMEQPGGREAHHTVVPTESDPDVQQRPTKQSMGQDDAGSSASLPPNPNPGYLTVIEMENAQLRSHLVQDTRQIEEVLA